jgi:hypothetical protein
MLSSESGPLRRPKPPKTVKSSRLRLNTHSATNSISSTHSTVTRDDWSSSTNGEHSPRAGETEAQPVDRNSHGLDHSTLVNEHQQSPVVLPTDRPDTAYEIPAVTKARGLITRDIERSSSKTSAAVPAATVEPPNTVAAPPSVATSSVAASQSTVVGPATVGSTTGTTNPAPTPAIEGTLLSNSQRPTANPNPAHILAPSGMATTQPHVLAHQPMHPTLAAIQPKMRYGVALFNQAELVRFSDGQSELDVARIKFLVEACETQDTYALLLHQIYVAHSKGMELPFAPDPDTRTLQAAFGVVNYILGNNDKLTPSLADYFLDFPTVWSELRQPHFARYVQRSRHTLTLFASKWEDSIRICASRGYPLEPAEVESAFSLMSPRLSIATFTAMLHRLGHPPNKIDRYAAVRLFTEFGSGTDRPNQWRQAYEQIMSQRSIQPTDRRSISANTQNSPPLRPPNFNSAFVQQNMSPPQNPPPLPSNNNPVFVQQDLGHQIAMGSSFAPNATRAPPLSYQAGSGIWPHQHPGYLANNYQQQPVAQQPGPPQRTNFGNRQYVFTNQHLQQSRQNAQVGPVPQQHLQTVNGLYNQNARAPRMGTFIQQLPPPGSVVSSQRGPVVGHNQPRSPAPRLISLLPQVGWNIPQAVHPQPDRIALHQAHLRSPVARIVDLDGKPQPDIRLYQVATKLEFSPHYLDPAIQLQELKFNILSDDTARKLVRTPPPHASLSTESHLFKAGALRWRLKCVALPLNSSGPPTESEFHASSTTWPEHIFTTFNQLDDVVPRRKTHYGRDLPSDLTDGIIDGPNSLNISFDAITTDKRYQKTFYVAVERVELFSHEHIIANIPTVSSEDALARITCSMKGNSSDDDGGEDDLQITNPSISINVADPFTATLWSIPVRTLTCKHRECFDLETFLNSRPKSQLAGPTGADDWKCPHCGRDARLGQLVKDGFLAEVREKLVSEGKEEVKAITVKEGGDWEAKIEKPAASNVEGRGRGSVTPGLPGLQGGPGNGTGSKEGSRAPSVSADVVMVLDDD